MSFIIDDSNVNYEDKTIDEIVKIKLKHNSFMNWKPIFENRLPFLEDLSPRIETLIKMNGPLLPLRRNIFKIFELVDINDIKVVILGQDPYDSVNEFSDPVAQGIAFSVPNHIKIRSSLTNIFAEINSEFNTNHNFNTDLTPWCNQGVFLLNTCLTVSLGKPGSHGELWRGFIFYVLESLKNNKNIIYLLWGNKAKEIDRRKFIVEVRKCLANRLTDKDENGIMIYDKLSRGTLREHSKEIPQFSLDFMQKELKSNVAVDNIYLEFVSDEFDKDIYIIDEKKRDVYITGMDLDILYKKRHSILLLYNGYHYDLLGKINDDEIITLFDPRDPLIKRIRKNIRNSVKKGK